jgi:hypothetical protein
MAVSLVDPKPRQRWRELANRHKWIVAEVTDQRVRIWSPVTGRSRNMTARYLQEHYRFEFTGGGAASRPPSRSESEHAAI